MAECTDTERAFLDALKTNERGVISLKHRQLLNIDYALKRPGLLSQMREAYATKQAAHNEWERLWDELKLPHEGGAISPVYEYCLGQIPELHGGLVK